MTGCNCLPLNRPIIEHSSKISKSCNKEHSDISALRNDLFLTLYRTYFIEYEFPVAADHGCAQGDKNDIGLEITRIATKKTTAQSKSVIHFS